jgi:hypothetical protein
MIIEGRGYASVASCLRIVIQKRRGLSFPKIETEFSRRQHVWFGGPAYAKWRMDIWN